MNKGSLRALPRRETRQSARIAATSTSDDAAPELPTPLADKRKKRPASAKEVTETDEVETAKEATEITQQGAKDEQPEEHKLELKTKSDEDESKNAENETLNEKRTREDSSDDDSDSDSDSDLDSCVEMINTSKANETMLKVNCSLNANNNDDFFVLDESYNLNLLKETEIIYLKNLTCSPMIFSTKVLFRIYAIGELHGHNISGKTMNKNEQPKKPLEQSRLMYIKWLVDKYFQIKSKKSAGVWKRCCKAINRTIRISERKAANQAANKTAKKATTKTPTIITQIPPIGNGSVVVDKAVSQSS